jgi:transcriptional regulator GlxA family with amidase domain
MNRSQALHRAAIGLTGAALAPSVASAQPSLDPVPDGLRLAPPADRPILVSVIVGDMATVIDFAGPWEVFQDAAVPGQFSGFQLAMVSQKLEPMEATAGMIITPRYTFESAPQPDVIVIGAQSDHTSEKISYIKEASKAAQVVMSVCTGAFLLAKTGLLNGLRATTHHDFYDRFAQKFPQVNLVRGPRYVENGKVCTAGGLASGIELALRVVQRYFGNEAVTQTAYYMEYSRSERRPAG